MTILLMQTFLLLLGAFLLGTSLACLTRRAISGPQVVAVPASTASLTAAAASAPIVAPKAADTDRFGRALAGGQGPAVPPVFSGQPVVEVQPLPAPPQQPAVPQTAAPRAEPAPQPAPPAPAAVAEPPPAPQPAPPPPSPPSGHLRSVGR